MTRLLARAVLLLALLLATTSPADVITVDDSGGADYAVIQDAVDAASHGDTVLVYAGTYADTLFNQYYYFPVNVWIDKGISLVSADGPEVTTIDGGGEVLFCVFADTHNDVVVEGFTITDAGWYDYGWYGAGAAILFVSGEMKGNTITNSLGGITTRQFFYAADAATSSPQRNRAVSIVDNTLEGNTYGIATRYDAVVSGNSIHGGGSGVIVSVPSGTSLVDNEISGNTTGVVIRNPSHTGGAHFTMELKRNRIVDNTDVNVDIGLWDVELGSHSTITLGGSQEDANDIHGAPVSVLASVQNIDLYLDATYNFWGSVACSLFVPLMDIEPEIPDSAVVYEPFVNATHDVVYEECEGVPVEEQSWGRVKAMYR